MVVHYPKCKNKLERYVSYYPFKSYITTAIQLIRELELSDQH